MDDENATPDDYITGLKNATPDDYITGLKNALVFHQSQVDKYNLAIHAFEEGYKAGVTVANDNQELASDTQNVGD